MLIIASLLHILTSVTSLIQACLNVGADKISLAHLNRSLVFYHVRFTRTWLRYVWIFAMANLSVCLSVKFMHSAQGVRQYFFAILYLSHPWLSYKIFAEIIPGEPQFCLLFYLGPVSNFQVFSCNLKIGSRQDKAHQNWVESRQTRQNCHVLWPVVFTPLIQTRQDIVLCCLDPVSINFVSSRPSFRFPSFSNPQYYICNCSHKTKLSCLVCSCVHTTDTDKTRQFGLVRVGGVNKL